jgi:hypothetical protein
MVESYDSVGRGCSSVVLLLFFSMCEVLGSRGTFGFFGRGDSSHPYLGVGIHGLTEGPPRFSLPGSL